MQPIEVMAQYQGIQVEDIQACLAYASDMTRERYVPVPVEG
jgi:uncharacterized protein (DUF433 family)